MKKLKNISIFFFFIFCYLLRGTIEEWRSQNLNVSNLENANNIIIQNLEQELEEMQKNLDITLPKEELQQTKVIYRDPYHFFDTITIVKGSEEGILKNSAVIDGQNLIGIVEEVNSHSSIVKLITNQTTNISVKINDAYGILKTNKEKECWIEDFTKDITIEKGEVVKTSGLTDIPGNIIIGKISEIEKSELGLIQRLKVELSSDFQNLNYVSILKKERNE